MSEVLHLLFPFNPIPRQTLNCNFEQTIIVPCNYNSNQSVSLPFFDDDQLLPGQSRITHFILEKPNLQPKIRPLSVQSLASCNNRQLFQLGYQIHNGFTSTETILIENALQIVAARLFKPEILQNMYQICGTSGCYLDAGVWSRSQLENSQKYHHLLRYQLRCLKQKSEDGQFPTIHIYPNYEKSDVQAEGTIGCVSCISHESTFSIKGNFEVKLNRYHLNENDSNAVYWAGAIVHEMLHNLGHKHQSNDYSDRWQVNLFEKCFIHNGNYALI